MDEVKYVIEGLSSQAANTILLALVLLGVWKLIHKAMDTFSLHLKNIEDLFAQSKNELKDLNQKVQDLNNSLDKHIIIVDNRLDAVESRISRLEERSKS